MKLKTPKKRKTSVRDYKNNLPYLLFRCFCLKQFEEKSTKNKILITKRVKLYEMLESELREVESKLFRGKGMRELES